MQEGGSPMGGNYERGMYNQLMEVMAKMDAMEADCRQGRREIQSLTSEVKTLRKENDRLRDEVSGLKQKNSDLEEKNGKLLAEVSLLQDDNERLKRILNNDSSNSSTPPSKDQPGKPANTYNSRQPTNKKHGAQSGHKGVNLSKADVEDKIRRGIYGHRIQEIGVRGRAYVTRYRLDLDIRTVATEIRIYADDDGRYRIPDDLKGDVTYGGVVKAIAAFLYSEGVVANDRICTFINSISGDSLNISTGCIYNFCRSFAGACSQTCAALEENLLNAVEICTDATPIKTNGKQTYIRNFSTENSVLYCSSDKKDLEALCSFRILKEFTGALTHDHETALYHFGTRHSECNVHLERYLLKNTEETGNLWSHNLSMFLKGLNHARRMLKKSGGICFTLKQLERFSFRYDEIIAEGFRVNATTKGRIAKKEEKALLNRLKKYKENHLLFIYDFRIHYSDNMSEKDLRICKNRQKMAGGFRTASGREMYCMIMSFIETVKRRKLNIFQSIMELMAGRPVLR